MLNLSHDDMHRKCQFILETTMYITIYCTNIYLKKECNIYIMKGSTSFIPRLSFASVGPNLEWSGWSQAN
jgi:hypothetical protein